MCEREQVMSASGAVDFLYANEVGGWIETDGNTPPRIALFGPGRRVDCELGGFRSDGGPRPRREFRVKLPSDIDVGLLADGTLYVAREQDGAWQRLPIWHALTGAAALNGLPLASLDQGMTFATYEARTSIAKAVQSVPTWRRLGSRKCAAIVTYANDSGGWFPYFHRHYAELFGADSIYVLTPKPKAFAGFELGGVVSFGGSAFDNDARAEFTSNFCTGLLAYHQWVAVPDVDEFIVAHPGSGRSIVDILDTSQSDVITCRGYDVIQDADEGDFDGEQGILSQRRWGVLNSALCKPLFARVPTRWSIGYHFTDKVPYLPDAGDAAVVLHLKFACRQMRRAVAEIVAGTSYARSSTQDYARQSLERLGHPLMDAQDEPRRMSHDGEALFQDFRKRFLSGMAFERRTGVWQRPHFFEPYLTDLRALSK